MSTGASAAAARTPSPSSATGSGCSTAFAPIYSLDPPTAGAPRREYGVALLSRHPIVAVENHDLTRLSTQDPNPVPAPAPGFLEATVQIRGARTHVYVTHLDYRGDPTVRAPPGRRHPRRSSTTTPTVPTSCSSATSTPTRARPSWRRLWTRLQRRVGRRARSATGAPGRTYPATNPTKRIDFVTASPGIDVVDATTAHDPTLLGASDHRAVAATVLLDQGSETSR